MFYDYKILDINNRGQMFDILELSSDSKRCRIQRKDLEAVFKDSKVGLDKLGHGQVVRLSERQLIQKAMLLY